MEREPFGDGEMDKIRASVTWPDDTASEVSETWREDRERALIRAAALRALDWVLEHKRAPGESRIRITTDFEEEILTLVDELKEKME